MQLNINTLTVDNKINFAIGLIICLAIVIGYYIYSKEYNNDNREHLDVTQGVPYIFNTGDATLSNVTLTGKLVIGNTVIDATNNGRITVGTPTSNTVIDPVTGKITVGTTSIDGTTGLVVGNKQIVAPDGTIPSSMITMPSTLTIGGTTIASDGTLSVTKGNLVVGGTIINATTGSVTTKGGSILDVDGSIKTNKVDVGSGKTVILQDGSITTQGNITGNRITVTNDLNVGGNLKLPNGVSFTSFSDGHLEMSMVNGAILYYGVDGVIRRYVPTV